MKKDYIFGLIAGFFTSIFLIFIIKNPKLDEVSGFAALEKIVWLLPFLFPVIFVFGLWFAKLLSSKIGNVLVQVAKFVEIGLLNTFIDFGILNLLMGVSGAFSGWQIAMFNTVSFTCAAINSFFWNKHWTFEKKEGKVEKEFLQFLIVSVIGWLINTGIVFLGTNFISPLFGSSGAMWVNLMKIFATVASMVWNFIGYKFWAFKKPEESAK